VFLSILYIYFLNGYKKREIKGNKSIHILENKSVKSAEEWKDAIVEEYKYLGIFNTNAEKYIHSVFIDCML
jgi:hypothetical protein